MFIRRNGSGGNSNVRVVVLTNDTRIGRRTLDALAARGIHIAAVIVESSHSLALCYRAKTPWGRNVEFPLALARSLWRRVRPRRVVGPHVSRATALRVSANRNNAKTRRLLIRARPDVLVLSGVGLVGADILAIPRLGTLNAHPALLPWVRGNGVVSQAIHRGVAAGATCHEVDRGIDTGRIIARRLLPIYEGDSLSSLEDRTSALATEMLVDVVAATCSSGVLPPASPQAARFPLCRWEELPIRSVTEGLVASGRARELFEQWAPLCENDQDYSLPNEIVSTALPRLNISPARPKNAANPA